MKLPKQASPVLRNSIPGNYKSSASGINPSVLCVALNGTVSTADDPDLCGFANYRTGFGGIVAFEDISRLR